MTEEYDAENLLNIGKKLAKFVSSTVPIFVCVYVCTFGVFVYICIVYAWVFKRMVGRGCSSD